MKINGALLALSAFQGTNAFVANTPNAFKPSPAFSYVGTLGEVVTTDMGVTGDLRQRQSFAASVPVQGSGPAKEIFDTQPNIKVQGNSLRTWAFLNPNVERVQVVMKTEGRPLDADVELWQGPDNTPEKMRVYVEDACLRPFSAVIGTPRGPNTIAIRNIGHLEFPLDACVVPETADSSAYDPLAIPDSEKGGQVIQGGALKTYPFDPMVDSVQIYLTTDGRPLNARIELLQGPNNNKQVIELYTEDGLDRPFYAILESPGSGNVVRICNTSTMEFPLTAWVDAFKIGNYVPGSDVVIS